MIDVKLTVAPQLKEFCRFKTPAELQIPLDGLLRAMGINDIGKQTRIVIDFDYSSHVMVYLQQLAGVDEIFDEETKTWKPKPTADELLLENAALRQRLKEVTK